MRPSRRLGLCFVAVLAAPGASDPAQAAADVCTPNGNTHPGAAVQKNVVQGVPNPDHRDIVDLPGHRFSVDDTTVVDLHALGIVLF